MLADLRTVTVKQIEEFLATTAADIELVVGGPPCQGFSTIGKREIADPRNALWEHFLALVDEIRPPYVLVENVEGLLVMDRGAVRRGIERAFHRIGYAMESRLLRSADYGVPQLRKRVIFLGWLHGLRPVSFPVPRSRRLVTVADAIFDLPPLEPGEKRSEYNGLPQTEYQQARRGHASLLHNHEAAHHAPELVEVLRHIPDGGNRKSIPPHLQPKSGFHNSYARLASWKPAIAVTSNMRKPSSSRTTHPVQPRGLTVREGLRLQSFDDDFVVLGSRSSQYLQVGNAVPPLLAEAVGREILRAFTANSTAQILAARYQGTQATADPPANAVQLQLPFSR
jgi:DNA (cytosine-5)-methyltransferase 1